MVSGVSADLLSVLVTMAMVALASFRRGTAAMVVVCTRHLVVGGADRVSVSATGICHDDFAGHTFLSFEKK